jgi:hypothetical protein
MSADVIGLVDDNPAMLSNVRFGRNRLIRALSVSLFGYTVSSLLKPLVAGAGPYPCYGAAPRCPGDCCGCNCAPRNTCGGNQCWYMCGGSLYWRCCDYTCDGSTTCICSVPVGYC